MAIEYEWRGAFDDREMSALHAEGFEHELTVDDWRGQVERHSLGWVCARRDGRSPVAENLDELMRAEDRAPLWAILGPKIRRLTPPVARADAKAWMAYVRSRTEVDPGTVGTVGYCMGGRLSLRMQ